MKKSLYTTLELLKEHRACEDGLKKLRKSLPTGTTEDTKINLLHILESNGLEHFFWSWRATTKKGSLSKRMILHDIVALVEPIYLKQYPDSSLFKKVLKALKTNKGLEESCNAAYAAAKAAYDAYDATKATKATKAAANAAFAANAASAAAYAASAYARKKMREKQTLIIKKYLIG